MKLVLNLRRCSATALGIVLLAACGNPTAAVPSSSASAASAASQPAYTIGLLASLSGPNAERGIAARDAMQLAAKQVNSAGGLGRRPVQLVVQDDRGEASQSVVAYRDILNQSPVAMVGPDMDAVAASILPLENQAKLPAMSLAGEESQLQPVHTFLFVVAPSPSILAGGLLSYLQKSQLHKLGVIREASAYGDAGVRRLSQQQHKYGVQLIADETYELTDTDLTRQLDNLKNNPAVQAVLLWASPGPAAIAVTKQFRKLGVSVPLLLTANQADPAYLQASGGAADGVILEANKPAIFQYLLPDDPSYQPLAQFLPAYKQATGRNAARSAMLAYDAFNMLAQAAARSGAAPDGMVAELQKTMYAGVSGPYAFSSGDHAGMQPGALAMVTVRNGAFVPIKPNCDGCAQTTVTKE